MKKSVRASLVVFVTMLLGPSVPVSPPLHADSPIHLRTSTGHFYVRIAEPKKWNDANAFARAFTATYEGTRLSNWHLATITDASENDYVFSVVLSGGEASFLGAQKTSGSLDDFRWVTGESFLYRNFAPGQPDLVREDVLEMGGIWGPQWNDEDGPASPIEESKPFILEHEPLRMSAR